MKRRILACTVVASFVSVAVAQPPAKESPEAVAIMKPEPATAVIPAKPPKTWLTYHLAHPGPGGTYPADPDCALFWKGKYHLHYIYQKGAHNHCFAHVSSPDMVHWTWQPTSLTTSQTRHGMFSGTAFLTKDGKPVIIYHGLGSGKNQISFAVDDNLEKWTKPYPMEGKTKSGKKSTTKYWDPDCWLNGDTYYAISGGKSATLFKSSDLKEWEELGELLHDDMPATLGVGRKEDISCANMFKLGDKWMLLCISHGMGCRYYLGTFKDEKYLPDFHARMNWKGHDMFAPESLLTPDGRRVMWAWCHLKGLPVQGGIQSLPRELSLPKDGVLHIKPLRELEKLRHDEKSESGIPVKSDTRHVLKEIAGDTLELQITIQPNKAKQFGVEVYCDKDAKSCFPITVDPAAKTLTVGTVKVPFELKAGEDLTLRIFLDKSVVEVFANDRQAVVAGHKYKPEHLGIGIFSKGGDALVKEANAWRMKSIYAGK